MIVHSSSGCIARLVAGMVVFAFVLLISCNGVSASIVAFDAFDYGAAGLKGCNGGTGWKNAWWARSKDSQVATTAAPLTYTFPTGELVDGGTSTLLLDHSAKSGGLHTATIKRNLATPISDDVVYASFLFRDDSPAIGNDMCLMWLGSYSGPKFGMVGSRGQDKTNDFGAAAGSLSPSTPSMGDLTLGQTYLIVARISKTKPGVRNTYNKVEMWVDPTIDDENSPDLTASIRKGAVSKFSYVGFGDRQNRGDTTYIDEARLGTSWTDVVPGPGAVPEPVTTVLLLAGGLAILWRKRRRPMLNARRRTPPSD